MARQTTVMALPPRSTSRNPSSSQEPLAALLLAAGLAHAENQSNPGNARRMKARRTRCLNMFIELQGRDRKVEGPTTGSTRHRRTTQAAKRPAGRRHCGHATANCRPARCRSFYPLQRLYLCVPTGRRTGPLPGSPGILWIPVLLWPTHLLGSAALPSLGPSLNEVAQ
jgi:hypothetical protein